MIKYANNDFWDNFSKTWQLSEVPGICGPLGPLESEPRKSADEIVPLIDPKQYNLTLIEFKPSSRFFDYDIADFQKQAISNFWMKVKGWEKDIDNYIADANKWIIKAPNWDDRIRIRKTQVYGE